MNKRLLILGGIVLAVSAIAVALLLFMNPRSTPEPENTTAPGGTITLPDGSVVPADAADAVNEPEPDGERNPDGTLKVEDPHLHDGDGHPEDIAECDEGPYSLPCEGEEAYTMPPAAAIDKASAASKNFAEAWLTIDPNEAPEARQARLAGAGGTGAVLTQVPALTRPQTRLTGLVTSSVPYGSMYAAFTRVSNGDIVLVVSVSAAVTYTLNGVQKQDWSMPGTMLISVNDAGQITNVSEDYPNLAGMS